MSTYGLTKGLRKNNDRRRGMIRLWKDQRRADALERQKKYDALTYGQKLKLIASRPGNSRREIDRLAKKANK